MTGYVVFWAHATRALSWLLWLAFGALAIGMFADHVHWSWVATAFLAAGIVTDVADDRKKELEQLYKEHSSR